MTTERTIGDTGVDEIQPDESLGESVEASDAEKDTSAQEQPEGKEPEVEGKEPEKAKEPQAEAYEVKLKRLAQSLKDKELKPIYEERKADKARIAELEKQVNTKLWDKDIAEYFNEEKETLGEDVAAERKARREKLKAQALDYQDNKTLVQEAKDKLANLTAVERMQKAREDLWPIHFPEIADAKRMEAYQKDLQRFENCRDLDQHEIILESIKEKRAAKPFKPANLGGGGGGRDLSKLTPEEKIEEGLKQIKTKSK